MPLPKLRVQPLRPNMIFTDKNGNLTKEAYDFLYALFTRVGGSLSNLDAATLLGANWSIPNPIGSSYPNTGQFTKFGCNGKTPQGAVTLPTAASDLSSALTLLNAIRSALIANGIGA